MENITNKDLDENNSNRENLSSNNEYLDMFFTACEYSGEFWGKLSASFINNTAYYTQIGIEGFRKSHNKYMDNVKPAFSNSTEKIKKTFYNE